MKKCCLVYAWITLFRTKYGMCANHALLGEIWYVLESRSFGRNMVCGRITLFRAKYLIEKLGWHAVKIIIPPWDRVNSSLWFQMATQREGATSTRQVTGHLNVENPRPSRLQMRGGQFSQRVAEGWNSLPDWVKQAASVNSFKNNLDKHWHPELRTDFHPGKWAH